MGAGEAVCMGKRFTLFLGAHLLLSQSACRERDNWPSGSKYLCVCVGAGGGGEELLLDTSGVGPE